MSFCCTRVLHPYSCGSFAGVIPAVGMKVQINHLTLGAAEGVGCVKKMLLAEVLGSPYLSPVVFLAADRER